MDIKLYESVQNIAKTVHSELGSFISAQSTERTIAETAQELLKQNGVTDTWYHEVPALVLLGSRSCESLSGRDYEPSDELVGEKNLVTVDLSPMIGQVWGDCTRSYFVENGKCTSTPVCKEFQEGISIELELHDNMVNFVTPSTSFSELFEFGNQEIKRSGFENLDFLGNLGHSIETSRSKRLFIDEACSETLGKVSFFTFEPHIRKHGGIWGFKHENIYYFNDVGQLVEL